MHLKGVNWNPVPWGGTHPPSATDYQTSVERDAELLHQMGVNAVRTYTPMTDRMVLDKLWARGIWVINTVYGYAGQTPQQAAEYVNAVKDHPAILMWVIGNEWNYNKLYSSMSFDDTLGRVRTVCDIIKQVDPDHPVSTIYGHIPDSSVLAKLSNIDVWGLNVYSGLNFGPVIADWEQRTGLPVYFGEYGADAWNALTNREDQDAQALATRVLTETIVQHSSVNGGSLLGGFVFELTDEWWKDGHGSVTNHDVGGAAPGGGPYPDLTFNEEWWGLVDIDRKPRKAFHALAEVQLPAGAATPELVPVDPGSGLPTTSLPSAIGLPPAACSDHPTCAPLGLSGDCCPTTGGVSLWCCGSSAETPIAAQPKLVPVDPGSGLPTTSLPSAIGLPSAVCSDHPACAPLGLPGDWDCCPTTAGYALLCCGSSAETPMAVPAAPGSVSSQPLTVPSNSSSDVPLSDPPALQALKVPSNSSSELSDPPAQVPSNSSSELSDPPAPPRALLRGAGRSWPGASGPDNWQ
ncbi:unnamed protein product [Polarella glacialis]|uniref:Glycoside hydrolase family 2 catalytic domain-containing protein n=1 Tax=Polarella glacialis TaxID=89957 RepID=A0A813EGP4_POLGL|nr:unnamed protein product [Polarella glacialis]